MSAEVAVDQQHGLRGGQRADSENHQYGADDHQPNEEWHAEQRHSFAAQAKRRGDEIDRATDGAEAAKDQSERPEIGAVAAGEGALGERRVGKPADIGRGAGALQARASEEAVVEEQAAECGHPETERVEAGKSDVANTQHQWDEIVGEANEDRHRDEENHRGAMHREEAIENFSGKYVQPRAGKLQPDQQNLNAPGD